MKTEARTAMEEVGETRRWLLVRIDKADKPLARPRY